ncbi:FAD-dependent oxidoreductase [Actinomadura sp. 3N508]|uniref:FAD-dependent oxidoreductase n=1 Tax=Actinomadura sp. 3N508 TaxID=3375153 RepID=UPI0037A12F78
MRGGGGGPLGMEIASACLAAGCAVTLVSEGRPLIAHLGRYLAGVLVKAALERGLAIVETGAARLERNAGCARVVLNGGGVIEAEVVVSAVGDVPNTGVAGSRVLTSRRPGTWRRSRRRTGRGTARCGAARSSRRRWPRPLSCAGTRHLPLRFEPYFWTEQFGLGLKAVGRLPVDGAPAFVEGGPGGPALMRFSHDDGSGVAVALNHRGPIPRLRRVGRAAT